MSTGDAGAFGELWKNLNGIIGLTALFVPIHQALLELYKLLGAKSRRYWEALAYIVYGRSIRLPLIQHTRQWPDDLFRIVPRSLDSMGPGVRDRWMRGPQLDLIQSFVLRAIGDSPVADISEGDIRNVVEIARLSAPRAVRRVSQVLEQMKASQTTIHAAQGLLGEIVVASEPGDWVEGFPPDSDAWVPELQDLVAKWREDLTAIVPRRRAAVAPLVNPGLVMLWEETFNERFLRGVLRARRELGNALKAGEFRYHEVLFRWSTALAIVEGVLIACVSRQLFKTQNLGEFVLIAFIGFAVMVLGSRGSKSLLDAIVGLGTRLKG